MSISRVASLAAALVIGATQVAVLSNPLSHAQAVRAVAAVAVADDAADRALPVVVVTAHNTLGRDRQAH
jgi:hypothetical protein